MLAKTGPGNSLWVAAMVETEMKTGRAQDLTMSLSTLQLSPLELQCWEAMGPIVARVDKV